MAKGQMKSKKEVRKPKAEKPKTKPGQAAPAPGAIKGLEHMKR